MGPPSLRRITYSHYLHMFVCLDLFSGFGSLKHIGSKKNVTMRVSEARATMPQFDESSKRSGRVHRQVQMITQRRIPKQIEVLGGTASPKQALVKIYSV